MLWVFETNVFIVQTDLFDIENVENRFSRFIVTIYNMVVERKTRGLRGFKGITRGYRGLQGVTGDYRGLQRITETRFLTRTSPVSFLGLFLVKIKVEEISNF